MIVQQKNDMLCTPSDNPSIGCGTSREHISVLHIFPDLVWVKNSRYRHLHFPLLLLCSFEGGLSLLQVQIAVVFARELPDLDEEVPEVVLEARDVLVQVE